MSRTCYWCVGGTLLTGCHRACCPASERDNKPFDTPAEAETVEGDDFVLVEDRYKRIDPFEDGV